VRQLLASGYFREGTMARIVEYLRGWWKRHIIDDAKNLWPEDYDCF
jgi:hypothetical protein